MSKFDFVLWYAFWGKNFVSYRLSTRVITAKVSFLFQELPKNAQRRMNANSHIPFRRNAKNLAKYLFDL
jgi:hypothetical protein